MADINTIRIGSVGGPACRLNQTANQPVQKDSYWHSTIQHLATLKTTQLTKRWFLLGTQRKANVSEHVSAKHAALVKTSTLYRILDVASQLFGAYDNRIPKAHRGGMIKSISLFMQLEH